MITHTVTADDGVTLALHRLTPPPAPTGGASAILLLHGAFTSHTVWLRGGAQNQGLARFLGARGHDVWLGNWRHHGFSAREPRPFAWHFEDTIRRDMPALLMALRRETAGAQIVCIGHSVGGAIGLAALARLPAQGPDALVTLGTPGPVMNLRRRVLARTMIAISRALGRFPARALRMGSEDEAALILSEWMNWNVQQRWIGADGFDYLAALDAPRVPILSIAGAADHLFAPAAACRALPATTHAVVGPGLDHRGLLLHPRADEHCWPLVAEWIAQLGVAARPAVRLATT